MQIDELAGRLVIFWNGRMSVDVKSDFSESESTPSPTTILQNHRVVNVKTEDVAEAAAVASSWHNYQMMPFWNATSQGEKMLQPTFDPQLYGRWPQMGDAGFYGHPDIYTSFGLPQMSANGQVTSSEAVDVKPPLSNGSSSSDSGMYPSPNDLTSTTTPFPSTSSGGGSSANEATAAAAAAANYQMRAATCYPQSVWPFMEYQQSFSWKMPLGSGIAKSRRSGNVSETLPTGPGTNNVRVRTADKYRMVYSDYQRLELEKEFHMSAFITSDRKSQLSTLLSLTERQIKIWFQNRRAKDRRDKQKVRL